MFAWIAIGLCIVQTAILSGLNLALFSVSRLRLEVEAAGGNSDAAKLYALRVDSNFALATIIWGNVATNVVLTLLSESVLAGLGAFLFSTVVVTLLGEIFPQAYFTRNALRLTARFAVFLKFYQVILFVVAKPTALHHSFRQESAAIQASAPSPAAAYPSKLTRRIAPPRQSTRPSTRPVLLFAARNFGQRVC